jgi:COX assembly protein 1
MRPMHYDQEDLSHSFAAKNLGGPKGLGEFNQRLFHEFLIKFQYAAGNDFSWHQYFPFSGDPDDKSLRKVEKEVLIPQVMRDRAKKEKCQDLVGEFESCCKGSSIFMIFKCREENDKLKACLGNWYKDETYIRECTEIYLNERSEFRRTGLQKKYRKYLLEREANLKAAGGANVH